MNKYYSNTRMAPTYVITVYSESGGDNHYLESRKVQHNGQEYAITAPMPLPDDLFKEIAASYMKQNSYDMDFAGPVPEHVIYASNTLGKTILIWYRPAMKRTLNFSSRLQIPSVEVCLPATLGAICKNELYYFALMNDGRPTDTTKLYNAPFFNIYEKGNVCLGTAPIGNIKAKTFPKEVERYEKGFFVAEQNHGHINTCKTPLESLWRSLIKKKATEFPSKTELVQNKHYKTVGDLIKLFNGQKSVGNG